MTMAWDDATVGGIEEPNDPLIAHLRVQDHRILLVQFPRARALPSISPFALKLETWLRVADLPYLNVSNKFRRFSSKQQIPYIELDGEQIADTHFIIKRLKKEFEKNNPDAELTPEQAALSKAYLALVENRLFWVAANGLAQRADWLGTEEGFAGHFPSAWKLRLFRAALKPFKIMLRRQCRLQGVRRLTALEIEAQAKADLSALSALLADRDYFFGDRPTTLDCAAFGLLVQFLYSPGCWPAPIKRHLEENCANLCAMVARMREAYWADWDEACSALSLHTEWKRARMIAERYSLAPCEVVDAPPAAGGEADDLPSSSQLEPNQ